MAWHVATDYESYRAARQEFRWDIPPDYNLAHDLLRKHDRPAQRVALYQAYPDGRRETYTFRDLDILSNQVAHGLKKLGLGIGDRAAIVLPQKPANPLTHLACWKIGAISIPLSVLFGHQSLAHRISDSEAKVAIVDSLVHEIVRNIQETTPTLEHVIVVDGHDASGVRTFEDLYTGMPWKCTIVPTNKETPATILYTSGSTGSPKGALHKHGVWVGHCPAFNMYCEHRINDMVAWTPADWAWIGALGDLLFPAWHYGRPVVGFPMGKFDPERAFAILEEFGITSAFLPPTAIRMMMNVDGPAERYDLCLETISSGGEPLTPEILAWAKTELQDVVVNELYGQTEANLLICNCQQWFEARPGSMGKPVPGHEVAVVDSQTGKRVNEGELGEIAVRRGDDPTIYEGYWRDPDRTAERTVNNWHLTGDLATRDADGYIWFKSRNDDLIITSGYRVGPGEVEQAILEHDAVEQVGVVGIPDNVRGSIIKAFIQLAANVSPSDSLREEIQTLVRDSLAKHEYPREIEFVRELPQTTTGKIQRSKLYGRD